MQEMIEQGKVKAQQEQAHKAEIGETRKKHLHQKHKEKEPEVQDPVQRSAARLVQRLVASQDSGKANAPRIVLNCLCGRLAAKRVAEVGCMQAERLRRTAARQKRSM